MNPSVVIDDVTPGEEGVAYPSLAAQQSAFLTVYSPAKGYAVETTFTDLLSLRSGFLKLLDAAPGLDLKAADLTHLVGAAGHILVCCARLRDAQDRVVAMTTAAQAILSAQDVAVLETTARHRLFAALGFGHEAVPAEDLPDPCDQAWAIPHEPVVPSVSDAMSLPDSLGVNTVPSATIRPETATVASALAEAPLAGFAPPVVASDSTVRPPPTARPAPGDPLVLMRQRIVALAALQGIEPPPITTREEGRTVLKQLTRRQTP